MQTCTDGRWSAAGEVCSRLCRAVRGHVGKLVEKALATTGETAGQTCQPAESGIAHKGGHDSADLRGEVYEPDLVFRRRTKKNIPIGAIFRTVSRLRRCSKGRTVHVAQPVRRVTVIPAVVDAVEEAGAVGTVRAADDGDGRAGLPVLTGNPRAARSSLASARVRVRVQRFVVRVSPESLYAYTR